MLGDEGAVLVLAQVALSMQPVPPASIVIEHTPIRGVDSLHLHTKKVIDRDAEHLAHCDEMV